MNKKNNRSSINMQRFWEVDIKLSCKRIVQSCTAALLLSSLIVNADVTLESEVQIADNGLYFDGVDLNYGNVDQANTGVPYDFFFGRSISAHGDAVKTYKHYVFMTWYRGGKDDRHVMLSRFNTITNETVDIEFPHRHTGFRGNPLIGESHNTIGLAVSPVNGTIHMVYDMHAYNDSNHDGVFKDDFFRYSYSVAGAAEVPDEEFTLAKFVKDTSSVSQGDDDYKHLVMTGNLADKSNFASLTYPKFFKTTDGTLLLYMRLGGNNNGAYVFNRYDAETQTWSRFNKFNLNNQASQGNAYNWGLYGNMKYLNGKLRVGFQQRSSDNNDKYKYQNGVYYAYSNHPEGVGEWFNHSDESITWPLVNSDEIKVYEPGDYITHEQPNSVYIVGSFDWTVTARGDIHTISRVSTNTSSSEAAQYGFADVPREDVYIHAYKPVGADEFIIDTDFVGASAIYTAGDNVYIIGLANNRPYVEVASGGTNTFERVYQQTSGLSFSHGTIYIENGKVYYYLMEQGAGSARPLHLQVIDLDIPQVNVTFEGSELTVVNGYTSLSITATESVLDADRSIARVGLYIDDELISVRDAAPFTWTESDTQLQGLNIGSYTIKAIVNDDLGGSSQSRMTLNVIDGTPTVSFAEANLNLLVDYESVNIEAMTTTPDSTRSISEVRLYLNDTLISADDTAPYQWTQAQSQLLNLAVGEYNLKLELVESNNATVEATSTLTVIDPLPQARFNQDSYTVTTGYDRLVLNVTASTPVSDRTIANVELYVNDNLIRTESVAPYDWGHNEAFSAELLNFPIGEHVMKAVVTDSAGLSSEVLVDFIVQEIVVAPVVAFSNGSLSLEEGYSDLTIDVDASSPMSSRTIAHVDLLVNDELVTQLTSGPYQWTSSMSMLATLSAGTYQFKAIATDSEDLQSEATMQLVVSPIVVDSTAPLLTLMGAQSISLNVGDTFTDDGATAMDNTDGDISSQIVTTGTVNTAVAGTYTLTYNVSDASGNAAVAVSRNVVVTAPAPTPAPTPNPGQSNSDSGGGSGGSSSPLILLGLVLLLTHRRMRR
jgi:hypothetical protein